MKERPRSPTDASVFDARGGGASIELGNDPCLDGVRVAAIDPLRAAQRGPGLVAFVLEDPMDAERFQRGDVVRLSQG